MTKQEILYNYPSLKNHPDVVGMLYGDIPNYTYDLKDYKKLETFREKFQYVHSTWANLETVDAYIFATNGSFSCYNTFIGNVRIAKDGRVLCGKIHIKYGGKTYDVNLIKMYGYNGLDILRFGNVVTGFSNKDGCGSPSPACFTKELDNDVIEHIINQPLSDYGIGIQKFMETARETYKQDPTNHIMGKCFCC